MTTPGDRIRRFCDQQGLTQAERDYLLGVLGEAVLAEREACALALDYFSAELPADCPDEGVRTVGNVLRTAARMIRARKESWPCRR